MPTIDLNEKIKEDLKKIKEAYGSKTYSEAVGKFIKSVDDREKVLGYPDGVPLYAKKNICVKCGYEDF
ncbi:unnamed protein product [marine sediment metagenome]|uniref:Uncharacterized protein n=1 Tax=marine sediment metagenome TaxID=412755 RepID=X1BXY9_9ZZZZ